MTQQLNHNETFVALSSPDNAFKCSTASSHRAMNERLEDWPCSVSHGDELLGTDEFDGGSQPPLKLELPEWPAASSDEEISRGRALLGTLSMDPTTFSRDDLCHLLSDIFEMAGLPLELQRNLGRVRRFILAVRACMYDNPYHNWYHVVDVTQTLFVLSRRTGLLERLSDWQRFALLSAGLCHDLEHPGVTSIFLSKNGEKISAAFKDGVLEKHHAIRTVEVMVDCNVGLLQGLTADAHREFHSALSDCILATEFARHNEFCERLQEMIKSGQQIPIQMEMELMIKSADISNVLKPFPIARRWALRVTDEFFGQGDLERVLNMDVTPICDRSTQGRVATQKGFIDFVCAPFFRDMSKVRAVRCPKTVMPRTFPNICCHERKEASHPVSVRSQQFPHQVWPCLAEVEANMLANRAEWAQYSDDVLEAHRDWSPEEETFSTALLRSPDQRRRAGPELDALFQSADNMRTVPIGLIRMLSRKWEGAENV